MPSEWIPEVFDGGERELEDEFGSSLLVLSVFASRAVAVAYCEDFKLPKQLDDAAATMRDLFTQAMFEHAMLGRSIAEVLRECQAAEEPPTPVAKVGRNEPCPCGSGRTFKNCCGSAVH